MANRDGREALRGAEEETVDLIAQVLTSDQWAELLKAPLESAALQGKRGLAQKLVGAGAEIGQALHAAVWGGHEEIANDLLENGASVAAKDSTGEGWTPLHLAAGEGNTEMVELLLLKGADKDALDNSDFTPLYFAALYGHVAAALALLAAGAEVNLEFSESKRSVVHVVAKGGHVDIMKAVIERGADVDAVDIMQCTPLHAAALSNKVEAIDVLVEAGANIEARDNDGCTPLHHAAFLLSLEASLALLKHGAHVNSQNNDQATPLHLAASLAGRQGTAGKVVDSLLRPGADETILNAEGKADADVVGEKVEAEDQLAEELDRVRTLSANAPADRAWRRRGYLVMCRAHPDRMRQMHESNNENAGVARRARTSAKLGRTETSSCTGTAGGSTVDGRTGGDWTGVVARMLVLQEEGIFRSIVGYL